MGVIRMTFSVHGLAVSRGIAIGRAVLVASSRADVAHYFVDADKTDLEISRVRVARNAVVDEITRLQRDLPKDAPHDNRACSKRFILITLLLCG